MWDFFISHATEDKATIARPLACVLATCKFRVWFDETSLSVGDSLRAGIERGLRESRYGVVILSPYFLRNQWTQDELSGFWARETQRTKVLLPIWHNIDRKTLVKRAPMLADRQAVNTERGLRHVARKLIEAAFPKRATPAPLLFRRFGDDDMGTTRSELANILDRAPSLTDMRLFLSAHPRLLSGNAMIPAFEVDADDFCDFVLLSVHGWSGGIELDFLKFGSLDDSAEVVSEIHSSWGRFQAALQFETDGLFEHNANQPHKPPAASSSRALGIAARVKALLSARTGDAKGVRSIDWDRPHRWFISFTVFVGRRSRCGADSRNELAQQLGIRVASYDRLTDDKLYY